MKKILVLLLAMSMIFSLVSCNGDKMTDSSKDKAVFEESKPKTYLYPAYSREGGKKKWGFIDDKGKFVIQPTYDSIEKVNDYELYRVGIDKSKEDSYEYYYGLVNTSAEKITEVKYDYIPEFSEGLATLNESDKKHIVIDPTGKVVFESEYDPYKFSEGFAAFCNNAKEEPLYGYMNKDGKVVIEPQFKHATEFHGGKALVTTKDDKKAIIDNTGNILINMPYKNASNYSDNALIFWDSDDKRGYASSDGKVLIDAKFINAEEFADGFAVVAVGKDYSDRKFGLINKKGEFVIKPEYGEIRSVKEGCYAVCKDGGFISSANQFRKKAVFNNQGKQLTDFLYYDVQDFKSSIASVNDGKYSLFIDINGAVVEGLPKIEQAGTLNKMGDVVQGNFDKETVYYNQKGEIIWEPSSVLCKLDNGAVVNEIKHRIDRYTLLYYPEIKNLPDPQVEKSINSVLKEKFYAGTINEEKPESDEPEYATIIDYSFNVEQNKNILVLEKNGYWYPVGAAHGQPLMEYYHININNGTFYSLKDLFKKDSNYTSRLKDIVMRQMAEKEKDENNMFFPEAKPDVSEKRDFIITKDALKIYFHPYEIAAYAGGFPKFDIPYQDIIDIIDTAGEFWNSFDKSLKDISKDDVKVVTQADDAEIKKLIESYEYKMIEAINANDFKIVEPYLIKDKELYNSQKKLVPNLSSQNIKEMLLGYTVDGISWDNGKNQCRVNVNERIAIQYPGKDFVEKEFNWVYTIEFNQEGKKYGLSGIEKWDKK